RLGPTAPVSPPHHGVMSTRMDGISHPLQALNRVDALRVEPWRRDANIDLTRTWGASRSVLIL
ncbi:MAG: hypothetical protein VX356_01500, partial [Candidatus Thermoplasmatota archaeon]